ncbi:MAG TPA: FAD-linked oxidase C-terminal domain-containing protein [Solirubrobacter sp.]
MEELATALERELAGDVRADAYTRHLYAADASMFALEPLAVAFPRDADDVARAVRVAARLGVPIVPRGGATSLAGQTAGGRGLVLDLSRHMTAIEAIDPEARTVRVQPGVVQEQLNQAVKRYGLVFGPDTSTSNRATLGGMIGNNSSGSESIVYGTTVDHVLELDVVLSDGSQATFSATSEPSTALERRIYVGVQRLLREHARAIAEDYPRHWRQSGGYRLDRLDPFDLSKLIVGSEGTLAIVTAATFRLVELPKAKMFAVGHFDSLLGAVDATHDALELQPHAVEMIDRTILGLSRAKVEFRALADRLDGDPEALLFVSFAGDTEDEVRAKLDQLERVWKEHGHGYFFLRAETAAQQDALTKVRKAGLGLLMAASEGRTRPAAFVEDTAVPPEHLREYVQRFQAIFDARGLKAGFYGHCSVGCLHIRPFLDLSRPDQVEMMLEVADEVVDLVAEFDGVNSSEHGDGRIRSPFSPRIFGDELYGAMRSVKRLFDPEGVFNPGVMVDAEALPIHIRDAEYPAAKPLVTHFDFPEGSMHGAADRCQRIGACRKTGTGVMCPSYMATREEEHATRGRANALVKALSEPDPAAALGDERLYEILDLCLECKACKSECPLSVDMATLKSEFLSQHNAIHGTPLRSRLFGAIRTLNKVGAATAPLSNAPLPRRLMERVTGIDHRRPLPRFERETLIKWAGSRPAAPAPSRGPVTFLADSFTTFTEPGVGRSAIELLDAAGYDVRLESGGCCGRASISKGLLDDATAKAEALSDRLASAAGVITGVEPSCVLTLREEHVQLIGDRGIAERTKLVEELLVEAIDDGALKLRDLGPRRILFHGHCHQKALAGTASTVALLQRIPGTEVVELDAGCCGMAGSFGFEAEHYDLSMQIGGMRLFPAVRQEPAETLIAATGVSCRQQIAHGTGRSARHPVQLVREALVE